MKKLSVISILLVVGALLILPSFSVVADEDEGIPWFGLIPYFITGGPPSNKPPIVVLTADPTSGEAPLTVEFDASNSRDKDGSIESYKWGFGDGGNGVGEQLFHTYTSKGKYTVSLTVTDDGGRANTFNKTITVTSPNQKPNASFSASPTSGTAPLKVTLDASSSNDPDGSIDSYEWNFGDNSRGTGRSITHTYNNSGSFTVQLTVTDDGGASDSASEMISVSSPSNEPPNASFSASPTSGEAPLDVSFDASSSTDPDGSISSYNWDFDDGSTVSGETTNHTFDNAGYYNVELTVTDNDGASDSTTKQIEVTSAGKPDTTITSGPSGEIDYRDVTFKWTGSDDVTATSDLVYSYKLEGVDDDWSNWAYDTSQSYSGLTNDSYTFRVRAKDGANNVDPTPATSSFTIKIVKPGNKKWAFDMEYSIYSSPAIAEDGTIYVGSYDNKLYAINPDGSKKWAFETGDSIFSSPAIGSDDTVYVGSGDKHLYAINPNGTQKWAFEAEDHIYSSPAIGSDGTIYVGSRDKHLYAINPDETKKWSFKTEDTIRSSPAIGSDGTIYVGSFDNKLYAINPDGSKKWAFETGDSIFSSPAIGSDGTVYVGSRDKSFYAINPDGTKKWAFEIGDQIHSSPAIAKDGTIYVGSRDIVSRKSKLYAINPDGTKKWAFEAAIIRSSPVIVSDGTIYVGSWNGKLYAIYGESEGLANTPWPMFHHDLKHTGRAE